MYNQDIFPWWWYYYSFGNVGEVVLLLKYKLMHFSFVDNNETMRVNFLKSTVQLLESDLSHVSCQATLFWSSAFSHTMIQVLTLFWNTKRCERGGNAGIWKKKNCYLIDAVESRSYKTENKHKIWQFNQQKHIYIYIAYSLSKVCHITIFIKSYLETLLRLKNKIKYKNIKKIIIKSKAIHGIQKKQGK